MDKFLEGVRRGVATYRAESCCLVAPLRAGLLALGYFNVLMSVILIVGTATESFVPTIAHVQELVMEEASKSTCILVPTAELAASVLLLAATHRKDVVLLRVYMYYGLAAAALSVLVYSVVIAGISVLYVVVIVASIAYQIYVVFLVRSLLVELSLQNSTGKKGAAPSETYTKIDPETPSDPTTSELGPEDKKKEDVKPTVEAVDEAPKLKTIEETPKTAADASATTSSGGTAFKVIVTSTTARAVAATPRVIYTTAKDSTISPPKESTDEKETDKTEKDIGGGARDAGPATTEGGPVKGKAGKSRRRFWK